MAEEKKILSLSFLSPVDISRRNQGTIPSIPVPQQRHRHVPEVELTSLYVSD